MGHAAVKAVAGLLSLILRIAVVAIAFALGIDT
jgi:hypothetical protein